MLYADYHLHTCFSPDSDTPVEDMIKAAIDRKLETICFTDHMDKDVFVENQEFVMDTERYLRKIRELSEKYKGKIEVLTGVELGLQPHLADFFHEYTRAYEFDFVLGSVHVVGGKDPYYPEFFDGKTDEQAYKEMLEETIQDLQTDTDFDVLGHLDYIVRYGKQREETYSYARYQEQIDTILRYLIEHGKGLEFNTAGWKYGLPFAHPHPEVLKRYVEMGGEIITIGSDAHRPEHISYAFEQVKPVLEACGVKYYTKFKKRKPFFEKIS